MQPLHLTHPRTLVVGQDPLDDLRLAQLDRVVRLRRGLREAPVDTAFALETDRDSRYQLWDVEDQGEVRFQVWLTESAEMVVFRAGTHQVVNYTIQSSLELDEPEFAARPLVHDCLGEDCWACSFAGKA